MCTIVQVTVDTEVCMLTTEMLHVLFKCFMELTSGAKREKVSLVVSVGAPPTHSDLPSIDPSSLQGHCVANMLALLELMSPRHYQVLRASFNTAADLEVSPLSLSLSSPSLSPLPLCCEM